ncbi:FecR family protein [Aquimarina sediminis]|uniref:FecR family protein n=1 Tax=Aquimarina sediminis TaxID=2070536 RepID=UPI000CA082E1|nr:FecR family protein [Aquimarina sediminis]
MEVTPELIEKYVKGTCTKEEENLVKQWLNTSDEDEEILEGVSFSPFLEKRLRENIRQTTQKDVKKVKSRRSHIFSWSIAASLAVLIGLGSYFSFFEFHTTYSTNAGQLQTVMLSDGTKVTLNAMSHLKVSRNFDDTNTRTVWLDGEGYFEVAKDSSRPFIVETKTSRTEVLGTQFNLSSYANDLTTLTLNEGKVIFSKQDESIDQGIVLLPNQQVILKNNALEKKEVNSSFSKAWMQKKLIYRGASFKEVVHDIERFYGITIKVKKEGLMDRLYRGSHDNPSLQDLIQKLSFVLQFEYKSKGKTLLIY